MRTQETIPRPNTEKDDTDGSAQEKGFDPTEPDDRANSCNDQSASPRYHRSDRIPGKSAGILSPRRSFDGWSDLPGDEPAAPEATRRADRRARAR